MRKECTQLVATERADAGRHISSARRTHAPVAPRPDEELRAGRLLAPSVPNVSARLAMKRDLPRLLWPATRMLKYTWRSSCLPGTVTAVD